MKKIASILFIFIVMGSCASKKASCDAYGSNPTKSMVSDSSKK